MQLVTIIPPARTRTARRTPRHIVVFINMKALRQFSYFSPNNSVGFPNTLSPLKVIELILFPHPLKTERSELGLAPYGSSSRLRH